MSRAVPAIGEALTPAVAGDATPDKPAFREIGGSMSDEWNTLIGDQAVQSLWPQSDPEARKQQFNGTVAALTGTNPKDELEGMMAAQLFAAHSAVMGCYARAALTEQPFERRREYLSQAGKLSRTFAALLEALNRHRGKGQQKVTVEHVHVHAGGQAVVGMVETQGGGDLSKPQEQPHTKEIAHAPKPTMWSTDAERKPVPVAGDAERSLPHARRQVTRSTKRQPERP